MVNKKLLYKVENKIQQAIGNAQSFAHQKFSQPIGLAEMAQAADLSPFHFARVFHKQTGFTPVQYLRTVRLNRAKELLRKDSMNVSEVGRAVGYPIVQHFSAVFKKTTGVSPKEFSKSFK